MSETGVVVQARIGFGPRYRSIFGVSCLSILGFSFFFFFFFFFSFYLASKYLYTLLVQYTCRNVPSSTKRLFSFLSILWFWDKVLWKVLPSLWYLFVIIICAFLGWYVISYVNQNQWISLGDTAPKKMCQQFPFVSLNALTTHWMNQT